MVTTEELAVLEAIVTRVRAVTDRPLDTSSEIRAGDVVQLKPGADAFWDTCLLWVQRIREDGGISGVIMLPNRGAYREAWYTFRPPDVFRVGHTPYPAPDRTSRSMQNYTEPCPECRYKRETDMLNKREADRLKKREGERRRRSMRRED